MEKQSSFSKRLSLKKVERKSHDCVFTPTSPPTSPTKKQSFIASPRKKSSSPRDANNVSFELRTPRNSPRSGLLRIRHIKDIGKGASGTIVYKAKIGGAVYCVKELPFNDASEQELNQLYDEIDLLKTLPSNSYIVEYIGYQKSTDKIQIIMILYDGTLLDFIRFLSRKEKFFSSIQIVKILKQLLKGLCILHNRRLMHRDLKSTNILFDGSYDNFDNMVFVLSDLGESKIVKKKR